MKPISFNEKIQQKIVEDFKKYISTTRLGTNKLEYSYTVEQTISKDIQKPIISFTPEAFNKMNILVDNTSDEIGWHGVVEQDGNHFKIIDILVYPQTVTGGNIRTNQQAYNAWLMDQPDEIFNNIRFQGHSHVNMGVTPSDFGPGSDVHLYESILQTLQKDDYYIFLITNKRRELYVLFYDMAQNVVFEKEDIKLQILLSNGQSLANWHKIETEKNVVKQLQYSPQAVSFIDSKKNPLIKSESVKNSKGKVGFQTSKESKTDTEAELTRRFRKEFFKEYGFYPDSMYASDSLSVRKHYQHNDVDDLQDYRRY